MSIIRWVVKRVIDAIEAEGVRLRPHIIGPITSVSVSRDGGGLEVVRDRFGRVPRQEGSDAGGRGDVKGGPGPVIGDGSTDGDGLASPILDDLRDKGVHLFDQVNVAGDLKAVDRDAALHDSPLNGDDHSVGGAS